MQGLPISSTRTYIKTKLDVIADIEQTYTVKK